MELSNERINGFNKQGWENRYRKEEKISQLMALKEDLKVKIKKNKVEKIQFKN